MASWPRSSARIEICSIGCPMSAWACRTANRRRSCGNNCKPQPAVRAAATCTTSHDILPTASCPRSTPSREDSRSVTPLSKSKPSGRGRRHARTRAKLPSEVTVWAARLTGQMLASDQEPQVRSGIELARELNVPAFDELALRGGQGREIRRLAPDRHRRLRGHRSWPCCQVDRGHSRRCRRAAATATTGGHGFGGINDDASRGQLLAQLQTAPERLAVEIAAALSDSVPGAESLLSQIAAGKASPLLLQEQSVATRLAPASWSDSTNVWPRSRPVCLRATSGFAS